MSASGNGGMRSTDNFENCVLKKKGSKAIALDPK